MNSLRSEALPTRSHQRRRPVRAAGGDHPFRDVRVGRPGEASTSRPPELPRNLVGLHVVVVDDDEDSLEYFAAALRACGATVTTASTAVDALGLVLERGPHVVLSDIAMVGQDGYWLVREIRGLPDRGTVPVLATTAYGREHSRARAVAGGFNDLLPKPVDPEVLCLAIARAAGR
ncbi:MAG TPA: response regulator [Candidatus Acidoferrum sp.]|nr:response regulator [Candidatus Acidoferrum sp.]